MSAPPLFVPPSALDPVVRALTYPYPAPAHDYVFRGGIAEPVPALTHAHRDGRIPVLAIGSNRAPEQLQRKFADMPGAEIAVERIRLAGFDVVYSAHLSGYAALAATLLQSPGVEVEISVTWLPPSLMARMHATEGIGVFYDYVELDALSIRVLAGGRMSRAFAYVCRLGALNLGGEPRGLAAITASGRRHAAIDQHDAQAAAIGKLGLGLDVETFVRENAAGPALRLAREQALAADALAFDWPDSRVHAVG
jgi:hypothetical protein